MTPRANHANRILELLERYDPARAERSTSAAGPRAVETAVKALRHADETRRPADRDRARRRRRSS